MKKVYFIETNSSYYIATKNEDGIRIIPEVSFRTNWSDKICKSDSKKEAAKFILNDFVSSPDSDDSAFFLITKENDEDFYNNIMNDIDENYNYYEEPEAPRVLAIADWDVII